MTEVTYYQCTTYFNEEWFFSDGSVETATVSASAIDTTSLEIATQHSYELVIAECKEILNTRYPDRTVIRSVVNIKRDSNVNFGVIPVPPIGGCAGTRYGCCPDGVTAKIDAAGSNCGCNCR